MHNAQVKQTLLAAVAYAALSVAAADGQIDSFELGCPAGHDGDREVRDGRGIERSWVDTHRPAWHTGSVMSTSTVIVLL